MGKGESDRAPAVDERLLRHRAAWAAKPVLRAVYRDYYRRLRAACVAGRTLEIGGGSGNYREYDPDAISIDILFTPWLDLVADAEALPFGDGAFANVVMVDVLHHLPRPLRFLKEAARVLPAEGRLVLVEPAVTWVSWIAWRFFHPEPVSLRVDPLAETGRGRDPFDANQAIPTLLFGRYREGLARAVPELRLLRVERLSFFAFPLAGGFRRWSLLPARFVPALLRAEDRLAPLLGPVMAFRLLAVLERLPRGAS